MVVLLTLAWGGWLVTLAPAATGGPLCDKTPALRGFIVSDAHFGWKHPGQPSNNTIAQAIGNIRERFPNLDVFLDSGDIHHANSDDIGRSDWTEVIGSGLGVLPFHVAPGNHELIAFGAAGPENPETRTMRITSIACRPYFSFDLKGVHIVCLPEQLMPNLVTDEALAWLELDLALNPDKTTLIITHNALAGTTLSHDSMVYRQVANSERIFEILDRHPNILAWMHGHNHTWELVERRGKFYVSNGRIGGFSPPYQGNFGASNLGGIYFEVGPDHLTVRGYSATANAFFDTMPGYEHMSRTLKVATSFDPEAPAAVSWGMGGSRDGQLLPAYQHHLLGPDGVQELFLTGVDSPVFSENSDLTITAEQPTGWSKARAMVGLSIAPQTDIQDEIDGVRFLHPGLEILPLGPDRMTRSLYSPQRAAKNTYYECVPGHTYRARVVLSAAEPGPSCRLRFHVADSSGEFLHEAEGTLHPLDTEPGTVEASLTIPADVAAGTIYADATTDNSVHVVVEARLEDLAVPVRLYEFELQEADATGDTADVALLLGDHTFRQPDIRPGTIQRFDLAKPLAAREVVHVAAQGNGRVTWLVRQTGLAWQVRNAPATQGPDGVITVGPLRNRYSDWHEVIIVPLAEPDAPYVHRMRGIERCRIEPYDRKNRQLRIHVDELIDDYAEFQILNCPGGPRIVDHAGHRMYESTIPGAFGVQPKGTGTVVIGF